MLLCAAEGLLIVLLAAAVNAADERTPFSYRTDGVLSSGETYSLSIDESPYIRREGETGDDGSRWGIDGGFPRTHITKFDLVVDGTHVWVPRKLYEDLSYVRSVDVHEFGGALRIDLKGSDASGSFRASFLFAGWRIERFVYHGEFPDSLWEYIVVHNSVAEVTDGEKPPIPPSAQSLRSDLPSARE